MPCVGSNDDVLSGVDYQMFKLDSNVNGKISKSVEIGNIDHHNSGFSLKQKPVCGKINQADYQTHSILDSGVDMINTTQQQQPPPPPCSDSTEVKTANWVTKSSVSKLDVYFTNFAEEELVLFSATASDDKFKLLHLQCSGDLQSTIRQVLHEDPRSVYRRNQCPDSLYYFTVDSAHVTCWFDANRAEVVRVQPKVLVSHCRD